MYHGLPKELQITRLMMRMEEALQTADANNDDLNWSREWQALKKEKAKEKGPRTHQSQVHRKSNLPQDVGFESMLEDRCCCHSRMAFESAGRALDGKSATQDG